MTVLSCSIRCFKSAKPLLHRCWELVSSHRIIRIWVKWKKSHLILRCVVIEKANYTLTCNSFLSESFDRLLQIRRSSQTLKTLKYIHWNLRMLWDVWKIYPSNMLAGSGWDISQCCCQPIVFLEISRCVQYRMVCCNCYQSWKLYRLQRTSDGVHWLQVFLNSISVKRPSSCSQWTHCAFSCLFSSLPSRQPAFFSPLSQKLDLCCLIHALWTCEPYWVI